MCDLGAKLTGRTIWFSTKNPLRQTMAGQLVVFALLVKMSTVRVKGWRGRDYIRSHEWLMVGRGGGVNIPPLPPSCTCKEGGILGTY